MNGHGWICRHFFVYDPNDNGLHACVFYINSHNFTSWFLKGER